jgi:CRP-like cAMP-binding protein
VADLILFFYNLYNQQDAFRLPLNRKEMAQFAGTTKESLIRTLSEFKNDRIIELDDREVSINSMEIIRILSRLG